MPSDDLVLGIDSSTQSTKVIAWNPQGEAIAEGRAPIPLLDCQANQFEQSPDDWWGSLLTAMKSLCAQVDASRIVSIAISNQRETFGFVDKNGRPTHSALVWLDERGRPFLDKLSAEIGADVLHNISGKPVDLTPVIYRLAWFCNQQAEACDQTDYFVDVQAYLNFRLTGRMATSWSSADPMGWFDIKDKKYSSTILDYFSLTEDRFPEVLKPGTLIGKIDASTAIETGLKKDTPVIAGGGDGQCAAVGTQCTQPGNAYFNLGTALIVGVWSPQCALSNEWRTLTSATGSGYVLEGVERTGAFLLNWFVETFTGQSQNAQTFTELEKQASLIPTGSNGLVTLPYWSGCMNPHWDPDARGCFVGLNGSHGRADMYRSVLEGLTMVMAHSLQAIVDAGVSAEKLIAIGGGTQSPLWCQMLADSMQRTLWLSDTKEASALGAGAIAAYGANWFDSIEQAADQMSGELRPIEHNHENAEKFTELMQIQRLVYENNAAIFQKLRQFQPS